MKTVPDDQQYGEGRKPRVLRDKAFARRLETACEGNPHCPTDAYRGKQKWIYDSLDEEFGVKLSAEAVRKWFSGESRPRPKIMTFLARLLEVDEAWLALGITPTLTPLEKKKRNAMATGAVNLVAGMFQLAGGHIAFPEDDSSHVYAIISGKRIEIDAVLPFYLGNDQFRATIADKNLDGKVVIAVLPQHEFYFRLVVLTPEVIRSAGERRGDFYEVVLEQRGIKWKAGANQISELASISELV
ncbi:helix-turn-helix domain-containing protein [Paracoccus thiocyanatus]|nr:helix-turn-helix domain-containing protein [Paracoccus thiocyanatus]